MKRTSFFEEELDKIDLGKEAPVREPLRQYYYIRKCRSLVAEKSARLGES